MRWKQIKKSKYEISEHGHVRNMLTRRIIKTGCGATSEYLVANINTDGTKRKAHLINRLVAIAFVPNPENKPEVNHKDGIKRNNFYENLEWVTKTENMQHAWRTGLIKQKK
jgi:hypothetical protein